MWIWLAILYLSAFAIFLECAHRAPVAEGEA
jgi:hypothetical protein